VIPTFLSRIKGGQCSPPRKPFSKIAWSWLGAFVGIYLVSVLNQIVFSDASNSLFLVGSFGASAVLIYGAPRAEFSQPRNLVFGHILCASIGITIYKYVPLSVPLLAATAVSISVVAMHFTRTIHPPGGATALIAVIGSAEVHDMGFLFVAYPIAAGALILLFVALIINNLSGNPKRHYPVFWW